MLTVAVGRPYPPTGLTTATWMDLPVQIVPVAALTTTQRHVYIDALLDGALRPGSDQVAHVVRWGDAWYLEDGHTRLVRAVLGGATHIPARVHRA